MRNLGKFNSNIEIQNAVSSGQLVKPYVAITGNNENYTFNYGTNIVFSLYNYVLDGTENTAIDTGLRLFNTTDFPNGFEIKLVVSNITWGNFKSFIRCKNPTGQYMGMTVRCKENSNGYVTVDLGNSNFSGNFIYSNKIDKITIHIDYDTQSFNCYWEEINKSGTKNGKIIINDTFIVGGEKDSNGNWKSDRFGNAVIEKLIVKKK